MQLQLTLWPSPSPSPLRAPCFPFPLGGCGQMLRKGIMTMDQDGVLGRDDIVMQVSHRWE